MHRFLFALLIAAPLAMPAQTITAFTHATVIDGRGGTPLTDATVIVRGATIERVGPAGSTAVPAGATVIDAQGKVLMPGLADMHVHLTGGWDGERSDFLAFPRYLNALLYAGVTTVHDVGNTLPYVQQMKQEIAAGRLTGPRIFMAGALVDGPDPVWPPISISMVSEAQAPGIVKMMKGSGADAIKAYVGLSERQLAAVVRAAAAESLRVIADLGPNSGSEWGIRAGIFAYAHAGTRPISTEAVEAMRARGLMNISTLAVYESFSGQRLMDLRFLDDSLLSQSMPPIFQTELRDFARRPRTSRDSASEQRMTAGLQVAMQNVRRLHQAGVPIVAGTDSPYPGVFFGEGLHRELELLVKAGLTPLEAITCATWNPARFSRDTTWGSIQPGKRADLLLINGRPQERIADTRRIALVMQNGRILPREQLTFASLKDAGYHAVGSALSTK